MLLLGLLATFNGFDYYLELHVGVLGALFKNICVMFFLPGISQRDYTQYYDHISKQKEEIRRCIQDFFTEHIQYKFLDEDCEYSLSVQDVGLVCTLVCTLSSESMLLACFSITSCYPDDFCVRFTSFNQVTLCDTSAVLSPCL